MANYTPLLHPGLPNYNKRLFADMAGDAPDDREDIINEWRIYRVICVITAADNLRVIAPSLGNAGANVNLDGDTAQEIDLHTALPTYLFPSHVMRGEAWIRCRTGFTGGSVSAITAELGDTNDPNGLVTATSVFTAGYASTPSAAEYANRVESAFIPTLTLTSTNGNLDTLTAGLLEIGIRYALLPQ
jgi:hypothetical protein